MADTAHIGDDELDRLLGINGGDAAVGEGRPLQFTDDALALVFADANAGTLRYVAALGKWMVWNGSVGILMKP